MPMHHNRAKAILKEGGTILGTAVTDYVATEVVPTIKAAGLDFFFLDTEHSAASYRDLQNLVRAAKAMDITAIVRVTQTEGHLISRALDCGAMGIVAPRVHSVAQAQKVVANMKFPPVGMRGYGLRSIIHDYDFAGAETEMQSSNDETMVILQMESKECVDAIYDITAIPEVDATMVGPFDLSVSLGIPGDFENPIFWDAFDRMVDACNKNGVAPGVHMGNTSMLRRAQEHGARYLVIGSDLSMMLRGWKEARNDIPAAESTQAGQGYM